MLKKTPRLPSGGLGYRVRIPITRTFNEPLMDGTAVVLTFEDGSVSIYESPDGGLTIVDQNTLELTLREEDAAREGTYEVQAYLAISPTKVIPTRLGRLDLTRSLPRTEV